MTNLIKTIQSRYPESINNSKWHNLLDSENSNDESTERLGARVLESLLLGKTFTFVTTGSSNTAGHDNVYMSAWPLQIQAYLTPFFKQFGVYGSNFRVRNAAVGGHLGLFSVLFGLFCFVVFGFKFGVL